MQRKGIKTLRQLCFESGANYDTLKKNKQRGCISFVNAWLIAEYLECDIKEIVEPDWQNQYKWTFVHFKTIEIS